MHELSLMCPQDRVEVLSEALDALERLKSDALGLALAMGVAGGSAIAPASLVVQ